MKFFGVLFAVVFFIVLTSCSLLREITDNDKLSKAEYQQILNRARKFISMIKHLPISEEDKLFVQEHLPKVHIRYTGYKQGIAKMVWKINPSYSIRIISKGDLLDKNCPTRLTVSRFKQ